MILYESLFFVDVDAVVASVSNFEHGETIPGIGGIENKSQSANEGHMPAFVCVRETAF